MCFQNCSRPPSWIFAEVKFGGISVSGTSVFVSQPNFVRICVIATELWPFKWIFIMAPSAILDFWEVKFDVTGSYGRPVSTSTPNFGKIAQRVIELWRFVFSKWRSDAILDFCGSKIWRYFCFRDVGFSYWAKLCANMCNCDRVMAI